MTKLTVGSLFAGIGGIDLGLERAGMETRWFSEIDPHASKVLAKHWPNVPNHGDIRNLGFAWVERVDVLAGGFPCQDLSNAGKRAGIEGERSGLWKEYARAISDLRPRYVLVENVPSLLVRGIGTVLRDLADIGYDAEWEVLGADDLGATQHRKRIWLLAYPHDPRLQGTIWAGKPHPPRERWTAAHSEPLRSARGLWPAGPRSLVHIPRMADGPTHRMDRLRGLGNSVVPQIPELIGGWIIEHARASGYLETAA